MLDLIKMVFILTLISTASGLSLSVLNEFTKDPIRFAELQNDYAPSIERLVEGYDNDPIEDSTEINVGKDEKGRDILRTVFPCKKNGETFVVGLDANGTGYAGEITVMLIVELETDTLKDVAVLKHKETKGVGTNLEEPFISQFSGLPMAAQVDLKSNGGKVDGMSGATFSSNGIMAAVKEGMAFYEQKKDDIRDAVK